MIKKYIRGSKKQCTEVIRELEKLGGKNVNNYFGDDTSCLYFIDKNGAISNCMQTCSLADIILECYEEIKLPNSKLKVIRGIEGRGNEIIELLESMGGKNAMFSGNDGDSYYFIDNKGYIVCRAIDDDFYDEYELEIMELHEKKQEYQLKPFDKVLVRDNVDYKWTCMLFSHIDNDFFNKFVCGGCHWKYCIPYEGNEHLAGTKDNPKE